MHAKETLFGDTQGDEIEAIVNLLKFMTQQIDRLEEIVMNSELYDDQETQRILLTSINAANESFQVLGSKLYTIGGTDLMQNAFKQVPLHRPISLLGLAWDGIGNWKDSINPS